MNFSLHYIVTCSAWRIFREPREGVHGGEAGAHRLHPSLVNGKVNIARSAGLQQWVRHYREIWKLKIMSNWGDLQQGLGQSGGKIIIFSLSLPL